MADDAHQPDLDAEWEALARYLARESPPEEQSRIRERLAADAERAALLESLDAALRPPVQESLSTSEVEAALASVLARRGPAEAALSVVPGSAAPIVERPTLQVARMRSQWRRAGLRAAAAVLVVAGGSMLWRATRSSSVPRSGEVVATAAVPFTTSVGRVDSLTLSDGSRVILGPASSLQVASGFGASTREVTLVGDAYFDVVHDERVPFVVHTASATMRDVGTTFTVQSDRGGGTRVAVTMGAVGVAARAGSGSPVVLRAGDRAVVAVDGVHVERGAVSSDELSWTRGTLVFHDAPIPEVAAALRRWFGLELLVTDSALSARRLTASFDRAAAGDVSAVLAAALGASATRTGDTLKLAPATSAR
ncbi:MAG TPA: FecR domain-containing protein [Gemmatimonadaceae bacterium]|nr:FecR domain-containing protein [Gemmatimonadaceae bacterium]